MKKKKEKIKKTKQMQFACSQMCKAPPKKKSVLLEVKDEEFEHIKLNLAQYIANLKDRHELDNFLTALATKYRGMRSTQAFMHLLGIR